MLLLWQEAAKWIGASEPFRNKTEDCKHNTNKLNNCGYSKHFREVQRLHYTEVPHRFPDNASAVARPKSYRSRHQSSAGSSPPYRFSAAEDIFSKSLWPVRKHSIAVWVYLRVYSQLNATFETKFKKIITFWYTYCVFRPFSLALSRNSVNHSKNRGFGHEGTGRFRPKHT